MQSVSFRIWTRVAVFISYDDTPRAPPNEEEYSLSTPSMRKADTIDIYPNAQHSLHPPQ